jgi:heterodisulfide reductase subunit B
MKYVYYPGCSLHGSSRPYDSSLRAVLTALGHDLEELDDWNCCGATMYMSVRETVALAVSARNLALAERKGDTLVAPCSACYTTLQKTNRYLRGIPRLRGQVDQALAEADLDYGLSVKVRHPLDIIVNHIGVETVLRHAKRRLDSLKIAPYYGCQIVRPEPGFDDPDWPTGMDDLFNALGAECVYFPDRVRCCGGMLMTTHPEVGEELTEDILVCAKRNGANVIVTTCPLCQMNLEGMQKPTNGNGGGKGDEGLIPVLFFTQLLGLALGVSADALDLKRSLVPLGDRLEALAGGRP